MDYFILDGEDAKGPYTIAQLRSMWNAGSVTGLTMHCKLGDPAWQPLHQIIHLIELEAAPAKPPKKLKSMHWAWWVVLAVGLFVWLLMHNSLWESIKAFVALILVGLLYFYPSIVGRNNRSRGGLLILNVAAGWTGVGWLIALIWAYSDRPKD